MLTLLAKKMSSFFIKKQIIKEEELVLYNYSFEILLSTILNTIVIILLMIITGKITETIFYLIGFFAIRSVAGGYHANTHFKCVLLLVFMYTMFILAIVYMPEIHIQAAGQAVLLLSIILNLALAPADNPNKPMDTEEKLKFKKLDRLIVISLSVVVFWLLIDSKTRILAFSAALGMLTISISLVFSIIQKMIEDKNVKLKGGKLYEQN